MSEESLYDDSFYFGRWFREMRHSKILMTPVALLFFGIFGLVAFFNLVMSFPGVILGIVLAPVLQRNAYYIEFLYPWAVAKWGHFYLVNRGGNKMVKKSDKNRGFHSRTIEQRVEVVPGRVYIHPIPQFGDNLGYLVVCLPASRDRIVAFMVDCGQADTTVEVIELIQEFHYRKKKIEIQSILCTHKHHDHTGGTRALMRHQSDMGKNITRVFGGAVEKVPECTDFVANGDILELPKSNSNDMNLLVEVEVIAVPSHTRGSVVFRLRPKVSGHTEFLFMGDSMFSGGAGVPFEADVGQETEKQLNKATGNTFFRGGIGIVAVERCFAEILSRTMPNDNSVESLERILIFTGHEYTTELLARQFNAQMESCRWRLFSPKDFFETAAQLYTAIHRRSLPHNTGKLLNIPSPLSREMYINPNFRSLRRSGEFVIRAINFWYDNFCKFKASPALHEQEQTKKNKPQRRKVQKTPSHTKSWTLDAENFSHNPFTTVYTEDLEELIQGIESGKIGRKQGAEKLREFTMKMDNPVVNKRPIPGFLPSDKNIWRGVSGLARLGSKISGMTLSDSQTMKTAPPIDSNSDRILVSLQRLLLVLGRLGFLETAEGNDITYRVKQLFREASVIMTEEFDAEMDETQDEIELGILKWMLYGIESNKLSCIATTCCMPFSSEAKQREFPEHPAIHFKKKVGELVSHDVYTCKICRNATGCFDVSRLDNPDEGHVEEELEETPSDEFGLEIPLDEVEQEIREPTAPGNKKSEWSEETRTDSDSRSQSELQHRSEGVEVQEESVDGVENVEIQETSINGMENVEIQETPVNGMENVEIQETSVNGMEGVEVEKSNIPQNQQSLLGGQDDEELSELVNQLTISVGVEGEEETEIPLDGRRE